MVGFEGCFLCFGIGDYVSNEVFVFVVGVFVLETYEFLGIVDD